MPGCPVMRSKDLVHWETISYVFQRLTDLPRYDLKEGTVYGRGHGPPASAIMTDGSMYGSHPIDEPHRGYIYTAEDPAGEWTLLSRPPHHHDASLFFDDDGKVYLFYGTGNFVSSRATERCGTGRYRPKDIRAGRRRAGTSGRKSGIQA